MSDLTFDQVYHLAMQLPPMERQRLAEELRHSPSALTARNILDTLNAHALHLRELGVKRIGLFGSHARGDARLDSDIDLLVEMVDANYSYFDLMGVQTYLEELFGREVDLAPEDALKPRLRPAITAEVIYAERV
jgi:hypothetical protein